MRVEATTKRYESLAGGPRHQDLAVSVLTDLCVKELHERLEMLRSYVSDKGAHSEFVNYIKRRGVATVSGHVPMGVGNRGERQHTDCSP